MKEYQKQVTNNIQYSPRLNGMHNTKRTASACTVPKPIFCD